jgi:hypothetical protein
LPCPLQAQHAHGEGKLDIAIDKDGSPSTWNCRWTWRSASSARRRTTRKRPRWPPRQDLADPALFMPTPAAACKVRNGRSRQCMPIRQGRAETQHADIDATYEFRCANPAALKSVETTIFKSFKRLYRLEARRAGPAGQGAARLTPKNPVLAW